MSSTLDSGLIQRLQLIAKTDDRQVNQAVWREIGIRAGRGCSCFDCPRIRSFQQSAEHRIRTACCRIYYGLRWTALSRV